MLFKKIKRYETLDKQQNRKIKRENQRKYNKICHKQSKIVLISLKQKDIDIFCIR